MPLDSNGAFTIMSGMCPQILFNYKKGQSAFLRGQRSTVLVHKETIKTLLDEAMKAHSSSFNLVLSYMDLKTYGYGKNYIW